MSCAEGGIGAGSGDDDEVVEKGCDDAKLGATDDNCIGKLTLLGKGFGPDHTADGSELLSALGF